MADKSAGDDGGVEQDDTALVYLKENPYPLPLAIDFERYIDELEGADPNDPDARELVQTLHTILDQIVDVSFGISPTKIACGQVTKNHTQRPIPAHNTVKSKEHTLSTTFRETANNKAAE